jgi:hypothetical protein
MTGMVIILHTAPAGAVKEIFFSPKENFIKNFRVRLYPDKINARKEIGREVSDPEVA